MNEITLIGRTTHSVEEGKTKTGTATAKFSLAVDRAYKDANGEKKTDFFPCVLFGKTAEVAVKYVAKGQQICVQGELNIDDYENDKGEKKKAVKVIVSRLELLGKSTTGDQDNSHGQEKKKKTVLEAFEDDEDVPF